MRYFIAVLVLFAPAHARADTDWYKEASKSVLVWPDCEDPQYAKSLGNRIRIPLISPYTVEKEMKEDFIELIDVRSDYEFQDMHLAGARNVPYDHMDYAKFGRDHLIVLYCGTCCCHEIPAAAGTLSKRGYKDIAVLRGGLQEIGNLVMWQAKEKRTPKQQVSLSCSYARAEVEKLVEKIELEEIPPIHFDFDKATLKGYSKKTLKMIAGILKRYDHVNLDVHGHTDEIGSDEYNLDLSKRRAAAVESFLKKSGVPQGRVKSSGFGATKPLAPNAGDGGRAQNRRVEFFWRESDATE